MPTRDIRTFRPHFCKVVRATFAVAALAAATPAAASESALDLTRHPAGYIALALFVVAYLAVVAEEFTHLRKSKPVVLAAGIIWAVIAGVYAARGDTESVGQGVRHTLLDFGELMLFLLCAMTYINAMEERGVFSALRVWLTRRGFSYRQLFWLTGILAFFISSVADNLTTALIMCAVVMAVGRDSARFISLSCINIVVAANAGGAFTPFGDITTLMVWQKGVVDFLQFFNLFIPSLVNFAVPAALMYFALPHTRPEPTRDRLVLKRGARRIIFLFFLTIATAISFHQFLHLPPVIGMMTGLAYLKLFGYYLKITHYNPTSARHSEEKLGDPVPFDVFSNIARAEWDTLLFFYGVVMCVGGLGFIGYLELTSNFLYGDLGPTVANISIGVLSAFIDNIPLMFAVLNMNPDMSLGQWLLITLTTGVGGSLLSIGSAAGVALMGQARGTYTFFTHLRWTPAIALGYAAAVGVHLWLNSSLFS